MHWEGRKIGVVGAFLGECLVLQDFSNVGLGPQVRLASRLATDVEELAGCFEELPHLVDCFRAYILWIEFAMLILLREFHKSILSLYNLRKFRALSSTNQLQIHAYQIIIDWNRVCSVPLLINCLLQSWNGVQKLLIAYKFQNYLHFFILGFLTLRHSIGVNAYKTLHPQRRWWISVDLRYFKVCLQILLMAIGCVRRVLFSRHLRSLACGLWLLSLSQRYFRHHTIARLRVVFEVQIQLLLNVHIKGFWLLFGLNRDAKSSFS